MKKRINKEIIVIAIISILFLMMSIVYADYLYNSNHVSFNNNNTTLTSTDLQSAIDELYNKCSNIPSVGTCPEGYECTPLNKVTYNANGGTFTGGSTTNDVYYSVTDGDIIEKISKTSNVDDDGNRLSGYDGYMPSGSYNDTVTIEGAESLEVEITYQTSYEASYSNVYVRDKNGNNIGWLYGAMKTVTYTITGDTVQFVFYNSKSHTNSYSNYLGYYAKVRGKKNNEYIRDLEVTKEEGEYSEPLKTDYLFKSWALNQDGSGTVYKTEEEVMNSLDTENTNIVLYAQYKLPICKRATTLHKETCNSDTSYTSLNCIGDGYEENEVITYGQLGTAGSEPSAGDAFDCDVNGDGIYDASTERFYYVSDYFDTQTQTFDSDYYVLFYSTSSNYLHWSDYYYNTGTYYTSGYRNTNGPDVAKTALPKTTGDNAWRDDLLKTRTRNIYVINNNGTITSTARTNFSYSGYAARLLTYQELKKACPNASSSNGSMSSCNYFFEGTAYANYPSISIGSWLENAYDTSWAWYISASSIYIYKGPANANYGEARPVIEIPKTDVSY